MDARDEVGARAPGNRAGLEATGVDVAERAIAAAQKKAAACGLAVRFLVWDALDLSGLGGQFDTVLDCGLFHIFDPDRPRSSPPPRRDRDLELAVGDVRRHAASSGRRCGTS